MGDSGALVDFAATSSPFFAAPAVPKPAMCGCEPRRHDGGCVRSARLLISTPILRAPVLSALKSMTSASIVVGRMSQHESHSTCDEIGTHQARDLDADDKSRDLTHSRHTVHSHRVKFKSKSRPVRPSLPHASTTADLRSTFDGFRMWLSVVYVYTNTCTCKLDFTFRVSDRAHRQSKCGVMPRPRVPVMFWFRFHALHKLESMNRMLPRRALELGAN